MRRYHLRCRVDDMRAGLPRRRRRIAFGATFTVLLAAGAALTGAPVIPVLGIAAVLGLPVIVAWGVLRRDRRRLRRWEEELSGPA